MKIDSSTTVLVTGATGGIGAAIARALHAKGATLLLTGRRRDTLASLADELAAEVIVADQACPEDCERLLERASDVDVAVLNAAHPASGSLFERSVDDVENIVRTNLTAPILTARHLGARMAARGSGHIVMIASVSGLVASPGASLYSATKFGLRGFGLSLRGDLYPHGVGVTVVHPGFIREAGMFANADVQLPPGVGTRRPEDVAKAVLRAVRSNPAEITVATLDQRLATLASALAPGVVDYVASRLPRARQLAADLDRGHQRHFESLRQGPPSQ